MARKVRKGLGLLKHRRFAKAVVFHRVAAGTEHRAAIRICEANTLLDAGANKGQFSLAFRALRPRARIIAFEPLPEAAEAYDRLFAGDHLAALHRVALAGASGSSEFHVADRTDNSSLLRPADGQALAFGVHPARTILVPVRRLDRTIDLSDLTHPIFLKIDVQGGELGVLEGCDKLDIVDFIYVELSFVELYEGQPLFQDVSLYLANRGFTIIGVFNQVTTNEFGPTQVDVLFGRRNVGG